MTAPQVQRAQRDAVRSRPRSLVRVTRHPLFSKLWIVRERDGDGWAAWTHPPYGTHLEAMNVARRIVAQRRIRDVRAIYNDFQVVN